MQCKACSFPFNLRRRNVWVVKYQKVWSKIELKKIEMDFLRLNFVDDYNNNIGGVDILD